jgi:hypothetical protein
MPKKLTLNVDDDLISFIHAYSKRNGVSVSKLFEQYILRLKATNQKSDLNPKTTTLYGLFQDSPIPDKKELRKRFHEKDSD